MLHQGDTELKGELLILFKTIDYSMPRPLKN